MHHQYFENQQHYEDVFARLLELYKELFKIENNIKTLEVEEVTDSMGGPKLPYFYKEKEKVIGSIEEILMDFKEKGGLS